VPLTLFVEADEVKIGASGMPLENYTGSITGVRIYDGFSTERQVNEIMEETNPFNE
jgi:hypothetical protein